MNLHNDAVLVTFASFSHYMIFLRLNESEGECIINNKKTTWLGVCLFIHLMLIILTSDEINYSYEI